MQFVILNKVKNLNASTSAFQILRFFYVAFLKVCLRGYCYLSAG